MSDIPIIFSAPMVRALLDGRKTMTRRLAWREVINRHRNYDFPPGHRKNGRVPSPWQRVKPGDRLWVREKHWCWGRWYRDVKTKTGRQCWRFRASDNPNVIPVVFSEPPGPKLERETLGFHKRPAIFLPREHSRLTLVVTATKIERLQDISEKDLRAEGAGIHPRCPSTAHDAYRITFNWLWDELHGRDAWDTNPDVVALTFTVHKQNIDALSKAEFA